VPGIIEAIGYRMFAEIGSGERRKIRLTAEQMLENDIRTFPVVTVVGGVSLTLNGVEELLRLTSDRASVVLTIQSIPPEETLQEKFLKSKPYLPEQTSYHVDESGVSTRFHIPKPPTPRILAAIRRSLLPLETYSSACAKQRTLEEFKKVV
jgi:hypothetical protein